MLSRTTFLSSRHPLYLFLGNDLSENTGGVTFPDNALLQINRLLEFSIVTYCPCEGLLHDGTRWARRRAAPRGNMGDPRRLGGAELRPWAGAAGECGRRLREVIAVHDGMVSREATHWAGPRLQTFAWPARIFGFDDLGGNRGLSRIRPRDISK